MSLVRVAFALLFVYVGLAPAAASGVLARRSVVISARPVLLELRGGKTKEVAASAPAAMPSMAKKEGKGVLMMYLTCAAIITAWVLLATVFYSVHEGWPMAQSLFYAVDTGMSIGFGAVAEQRLSTKFFTIFHVLLGASAVGGAIALFAESVVSAQGGLAASEYTIAAIEAAFMRADADGSGFLSPAELGKALKELRLQLNAQDLDDAIARFDTDGDGSITVSEFLDAVYPHLADAETVEAAILKAASRQSSKNLVKICHTVTFFLSKHRTLVLWALWIGAGAVWGCVTQGWHPIHGLYFAVGALATGGLEAPALRADGTLPNGAALFVALYWFLFGSLSGIPIFAMALGDFANTFVQRYISARERRAIQQPLNGDEFEFAQTLFKKDSKVDLAEFVAMELLRLGKVDMATLDLIKAEFERLDTDHSGKLTLKEVQANGK